MFPKILAIFKECIQKNHYIVTLHCEEEMDDDELSIYDIENAILTGAIVERQKQREVAEKEWKYVIRGSTQDGATIEVVAKLTPTNKMILITTYRE